MKDYSIILAADLPSPAEVLSVIERTAAVVDGVKLGVATLLEAGTDIIKRTRDLTEGRPLLADLKIADIGFRSAKGWEGTNAKIIGSLEGTGVTHVTVHGFPGPLSVAEAVARARDAGIGVLLLPLMSHAGAGLFFSGPADRSRVAEECRAAGLDGSLSEDLCCKTVTDAILLLGEALDVHGYIGPATRPNDLERYRASTDKPIWCPGFGRQDRLGRNLEEQFRDWAGIVGPASAAIVGSAIFKAEDPAAAAAEIAEFRDRATR
jgi:orotidine 5'-phosphate decarboxylase subfamily 1